MPHVYPCILVQNLKTKVTDEAYVFFFIVLKIGSFGCRIDVCFSVQCQLCCVIGNVQGVVFTQIIL